MQSDTIERLTQIAQNAAVRLHVRSALNPLLWLCAICSPIAFVLACFVSGIIQVALLSVGSLPIVCACGAYIYWMLVSPNRLHSEDYQLRQQASELIHEKGSKEGLFANSVIAITNPSMHQLPEDNE